MKKTTKKTATPAVATVTKTKGSFLKFWDDNGSKITHSYLVEATIEQNGKMYAKIDMEARYSKAKDTLGILVTLGNKATMYFGASTKKLGRVFVGEPKKIESTETRVEESVL